MLDWFNAIFRVLIGSYASLFGDLHPLVSLTPLSIVVGVIMLWVFGLTSDQDAIETTKKRLQAYLLELRLYGDDPSLIWQSQKSLLAANLRYMGLMLKPAIYLTLPMVVLLFHLDSFYGLKPLRVSEPMVVTVQVSGEIATDTVAPSLTAPAGITVETPAVRALEPGQFSWRIRPARETSGNLKFNWEGHGSWEKSVVSGDRRKYLNHRRVNASLESLMHPGEDLLGVAGVEWVEILYPAATIELWGVDLHWLIWFFVISMVSAYLLKGYFKVVI